MEFQLISIDGMMEIKKSPLGKYKSNNYCRQEPLNLVGRSMMRNGKFA